MEKKERIATILHSKKGGIDRKSERKFNRMEFDCCIRRILLMQLLIIKYQNPFIIIHLSRQKHNKN